MTGGRDHGHNETVREKARPSLPLPRAAACAALLVAAFALACALSPANAAAAPARASAGPAIVSLTAQTATQPLPAAGAAVLLRVRVRDATVCTFLAQRTSFSELFPVGHVACSSGSASLRVPAIANAYETPVALSYTVRASGHGASVVQSISLREAAHPAAVPPTPPPVVPPTTTPPTTTPPPVTTPPVTTPGKPVPPPPVTTPTVTATPGTPSPAPAHLPPVSMRSTNWSGYMIPSSGPLITSVSGAFTVPTLDCAKTPNAGASTWAGIGGVGWSSGGSSGALLQTGVTTDCVNGVQQNYAWWEQYPSTPNQATPFRGLPVVAGDAIAVSVFQTGGAWETRVDDLARGLSGMMVTGQGWGVVSDGSTNFPLQGSTVGVSYAGGYTAEWIVEAYTQADTTTVPLAAYGTVSFTGLLTSLPGWALTANEGVALVQAGSVVSTPSLPSAGGFTLSYTG
jgi:hypothetical protein